MPEYVILGNFTQKRVETIKELEAGIKDSEKVESFGVKIVKLVFTMGARAKMVENIPQDRFTVDIFQAPSEGRVALITRNR
jgi:uncharacterized protein with GYD domain